MEQSALSDLSRNVEKSNVPTLELLAAKKVAEEPSKLMEEANGVIIDYVARIIDSYISKLPQTLHEPVKDRLAQMNDWQVAPYVEGTLTGHTGTVACLRILPGNMLASGSSDKTIKMWNTVTE